MISGGAFSRFSLFAMSITPYITASIVIQLLGMIIPSLEKLTKEGGEEGRKKINRYTKLLTIVLATVEAIGVYLSYKSSSLVKNNFTISIEASSDNPNLPSVCASSPLFTVALINE